MCLRAGGEDQADGEGESDPERDGEVILLALVMALYSYGLHGGISYGPI